MRMFFLGFLSLIALGVPISAQADTSPPTTTLLGEMNQSVVSNECYIVRGASMFQRADGANRVFLSIPEMAAAGYELNGRATLFFTDEDAGTAHFNYAADYPSDVQVASFRNYTQTYTPSSKTLAVHFALVFPHCTLQVFATYAAQ